MFTVIRDFLLEPALVTCALLLLPAFLLLFAANRWRRARGHDGVGLARLIVAALVGSLVSLLAILSCFSASVLTGYDALQSLAWLVLAVGWALVAGKVARLGGASFALGALLAGTALALDTWGTAAILFE